MSQAQAPKKIDKTELTKDEVRILYVVCIFARKGGITLEKLPQEIRIEFQKPAPFITVTKILESLERKNLISCDNLKWFPSEEGIAEIQHVKAHEAELLLPSKNPHQPMRFLA